MVAAARSGRDVGVSAWPALVPQERGAECLVVHRMYEMNTLYIMGVDVAYAGMKGFEVEQRRDKIGREAGVEKRRSPR